MTTFIVNTNFGAFNAMLTYLMSHFLIHVILWQFTLLHTVAFLEYK